MTTLHGFLTRLFTQSILSVVIHLTSYCYIYYPAVSIGCYCFVLVHTYLTQQA